MISRLLLVLALAVLAYIVYITMTNDTFANGSSPKQNNSNNVKIQIPQANRIHSPKIEKMTVDNTPVNNMPIYTPPVISIPQINYEHFANAPGIVQEVKNVEPAPFKENKPEDNGLYASVKYSGLVDANPNDSLQIEGTDLLTAPLVDNMLYTNSISNVNRNASQDLRGDISVQFDKNYTPFYTSTIAGVDRLGGSMNIGGREGVTGKVAA
jgi:hypothetical protein